MYVYLKRCFDFVTAVSIGLVASPILLILALLVKLTSSGPVFFEQKRVGINKTFFQMLKFRTMFVDAPNDMPTHMLQNPAAFITPVGKFLRKSSLDELPQLINILKGEMSFIGPRPALWNQDDLVAEREKYGANDLRPGLTGWAQVNGRDELPIPMKAAFDGEYSKKISLIFDLKIIFLTVYCLFSARGVQEGASSNKDEE